MIRVCIWHEAVSRRPLSIAKFSVVAGGMLARECHDSQRAHYLQHVAMYRGALEGLREGKGWLKGKGNNVHRVTSSGNHFMTKNTPQNLFWHERSLWLGLQGGTRKARGVGERRRAEETDPISSGGFTG